MTLHEALDHQPTQLKFGTSGLRGLVTDMTDLECYINTQGFLAYLHAVGSLKGGDTVYVGGDLRDSTPRITGAVMRAAGDAGYAPVFCGWLPTPALAFYALSQGKACVMVTGSHIPADRNGIKFYKPDGEVMKADEAAIFEAVAAARQRVYEAPAPDSPFGSGGMFKEPAGLPRPAPEAIDTYKSRYLSFFAPNLLDNLPIVVYQHSSVGRDLLAETLKALGAQVITVGRSESFIPIDTENVTARDKAYFKQLAAEHPQAFAILSVDGDADRPFIVDERGVFHNGDMVGCLTADYLNARYAALPISANDAAVSFLAERDIKLTQTKIGSPYVIEAMMAHDQASVSWEVNGGFLVGTSFQKAGRTLTPLPTRDGLLPILAVLAQAVEQKVTLSGLFARFKPRYMSSGLIDGVDQAASHELIAKLQSPDGEQILKTQGFGAITDANALDGLKLTASNGDVIHFRPSGNAPQLRVYATADTPQRAEAIVSDAVTADGWLRPLLATL